MENSEQPIKKKRGRKPKNVQPADNEEPPVPKKRGRKPKGGKLITKINENNENPVEISNVILHLKCSLKDIINNNNSQLNTNNEITYNPNVPPTVEYFNNDKTNYTEYSNEIIENNIIDNNDSNNNINITIEEEDPNKTLTQKLKILKMKLYKNDNIKKSACFWCTYDFDNEAC
jgi:hypothetical protein